ncbi:MAG: EF-hand domain-containing protein [Bacillota bacterium]
MINSVGFNQNYWYTSLRNEAANAAAEASADSNLDMLIVAGSTDSEASREALSPEDHMKRMQGGAPRMKPMGPPPEGMEQPSLSSEIDTDSDGTLSEDEYENLVSLFGDENALSTEDFFTKFDTDGDGEITSSEIETVLGEENSDMKPMGLPPEGMRPPGLPPEIDTDGDGALSEDEYTSLISQLGDENALRVEDFFAKFDTDGDGKISSSEMEAVLGEEGANKPPMGPPPIENQEASATSSDAQQDTDDSTYSASNDLAMLALNVLKAYQQNDGYAFGLREESRMNSMA